MTSTDQYRTKAIEFSARALTENDPKGRDAWNQLAAVYLRLAEQADKNSAIDRVSEAPTRGTKREAKE